MSYDSNTTDCNDDKLFKIMAGINVTTGLVSALIGIVLLLFKLYLKKHQFHPQRLVMWLILIVIIQGITSAININSFFSPTIQNTTSALSYCAFCGFAQLYSLYLEFLIILWIVIDMFLMAVFHFYASKHFETVQVSSTFLLPLLLVWIPLVNSRYGNTGPICSIRYVDLATCDRDLIGYYYLIFIQFAPQAITATAMFILYLITHAKLKRERTRYKGIYDPKSKTEVEYLIKKFRTLQAYPVIYFVFSISSVVFAIVEFTKPETIHPILQTLAILSNNLQGVAIALAFTIESKTCSRMFVVCKKWTIGKRKRSASVCTYHNSSMYISYTDSFIPTGIKKVDVELQ